MAAYHDVICQKLHNQRVIHHQWALCTSPTRYIYMGYPTNYPTKKGMVA